MPRMEASTSFPEPGRGLLKLVIDPVFGPYFGAKLLSTTGIWIFTIVAAMLVFELSGSALVVGLVSVALFGPQLVLAPLAGAMADRGDRRRQLVAGKLLVAGASGSLSFWIWQVGADKLPGTWPVMVISFVVGLGFVLIGAAGNALIPALVRPEELSQAIALNTVPPTLGRATGPAIGAVIATTSGPVVAFAITAVTNLLFALVVATLDIRTRADKSGGADRRIRAGVQHLRKDRRILPLLLGTAAVAVGSDPTITLAPSLSASFGAGTRLVGVFASAFGAGAFAAFLVLTPLRLRVGLQRLGSLGLLGLAAGIAASGISPTPGIAVVALTVAGVCMTVALTSLTTQLQEWAPDEIRGRIMALWIIAFLGTRPLAAAVSGAVADATTPATAFLLVALVVTAAAWQCRPAMLASERGSCDR